LYQACGLQLANRVRRQACRGATSFRRASDPHSRSPGPGFMAYGGSDAESLHHTCGKGRMATRQPTEACKHAAWPQWSCVCTLASISHRTLFIEL